MTMVVDRAPVEAAGVIEVHDPDEPRGNCPERLPRRRRGGPRRRRRGRPVSRAVPVHGRIAILQGAADRIARDAEAFAITIAREGIKTIREARAEVGRAAETLRLSAEEARRLHGETLALDQRPGSEDKLGYWVRQPLGVIVAITPFNDPLNLVAHKVGPAIAAGNAVILKPHSQTPLSAIRAHGRGSPTDCGPGDHRSRRGDRRSARGRSAGGDGVVHRRAGRRRPRRPRRGPKEAHPGARGELAGDRPRRCGPRTRRLGDRLRRPLGGRPELPPRPADHRPARRRQATPTVARRTSDSGRDRPEARCRHGHGAGGQRRRGRSDHGHHQRSGGPRGAGPGRRDPDRPADRAHPH